LKVHYLALGDLIEARLAALRPRWPQLAILPARDLAGVRESEQRLPAVHVLYAGDQLDAAQARGAIQTTDQGWLVVAAVRDVRQPGVSAAQMGELLDGLLTTLLGWRPSDAHSPLRRVQGPNPTYRGAVLYVPLLFRSRLLRTGGRLTEET
jgi:hypothetical protein